MKEIKWLIPCLALFALTAISCRNKAPVAAGGRPVYVKVAEVSKEPLRIPVHTSGILLLADELRLSFKTGGIVSGIMAEEGDRVRKGDILATLNLSEISAQEDIARAACEKALRDYSRAKNLYADSVITLEQLQNASTALSAASSNLRIAEFNKTNSSIIAPDNGIILKQMIRQNELVAPGYPVFLFGTSGKNWKVRAGVSDRDVVRIAYGDSAVVETDAWPGVIFPAFVEQIGELADLSAGTYTVGLTLADKGYRLAAGFVVSVDIYPAAGDSCMMIPIESLIEPDGQNGYIFSVSDSVVRKEKVQIVSISGSRVAVRSGTQAYTKVVSEGAAYLRDGEKVRIVR